jgi:hypothetical protein
MLLQPSQAAAESDPAVVTLPERTAFNPLHFDYEVSVEDASAAGDLFVFWKDDYDETVVPVPSAGGSVTPDFGNGGLGHVIVARCEDGPILPFCSEVARSAEIAAYSGFGIRTKVNEGMPIAPGPNVALVELWPRHTEFEKPRLSWDVLGENEQVLASGTVLQGAVEAEAGTAYLRVPFTVPSGTGTGDYVLRVGASAETESFGMIEGVTDLEPFRVDADAPVVEIAADLRMIYPAYDGHRDFLTVTAQSSEKGWSTLEVFNGVGEVVYTQTERVGLTAPELVWNGMDGDTLVPEGPYALRVTTVDDAGNTPTPWEGSVEVSHDKIRWETFTTTGSAREALAGKPFVGRCSSLVRKPRGGLGLYSQTKCHNAGRASTVATYSGAYIPKAFHGTYGWTQVTLRGEPANRSSRNYVALGLVKPGTDRVIEQRILRRDGGSTPKVDAQHLVRDRRTQRPYLIWSTGLSNGSRYNVAKYTLKLRYWVLD